MRELRTALLTIGLLVAGCEGRAPSAPPAAEAPAAEKPSAPPAAEPKPEEPAPEPGVPDQPANGECATMESCGTAAADEERQGHLDRAVPLYQRACDLGLGQACHRLGELYRDGKGVAPDDGRARALFEQGCRAGSEAACDALGH